MAKYLQLKIFDRDSSEAIAVLQVTNLEVTFSQVLDFAAWGRC